MPKGGSPNPTTAPSTAWGAVGAASVSKPHHLHPMSQKDSFSMPTPPRPQPQPRWLSRAPSPAVPSPARFTPKAAPFPEQTERSRSTEVPSPLRAPQPSSRAPPGPTVAVGSAPGTAPCGIPGTHPQTPSTPLQPPSPPVLCWGHLGGDTEGLAWAGGSAAAGCHPRGSTTGAGPGALGHEALGAPVPIPLSASAVRQAGQAGRQTDRQTPAAHPGSRSRALGLRRWDESGRGAVPGLSSVPWVGRALAAPSPCPARRRAPGSARGSLPGRGLPQMPRRRSGTCRKSRAPVKSPACMGTCCNNRCKRPPG